MFVCLFVYAGAKAGVKVSGKIIIGKINAAIVIINDSDLLTITDNMTPQTSPIMIPEFNMLNA